MRPRLRWGDNKNTIGIVSLILLAVIFHQEGYTRFLMYTSLGKLLVVAALIALTLLGKTFGIAGALLIVLIMNAHDFVSMTYLEGFETKEKGKAEVKDKEEVTQIVQATVSAPPVQAKEGFNMVDREGTLLRGKRSNEIPIDRSFLKEPEDVAPNDLGTLFASFF